MVLAEDDAEGLSRLQAEAATANLEVVGAVSTLQQAIELAEAGAEAGSDGATIPADIDTAPADATATAEAATAEPCILLSLKQARQLTEQLEEISGKLANRKLIEKAKGLLMERGLTEEQAFGRMRRIAMNSRKPLREVAEALIMLESLR